MEEYFGQKCVTADAAPAPATPISTWTAAHRCECVMVQENAQANGASRAVLASIVAMTTESKKTSRVIFIALDAASGKLRTAVQHEKLVVHDFASNLSVLESTLTEDLQRLPVLDLIQATLEETLVLDISPRSVATSAASARASVVVIDSMNVLLEMYPLHRVLAWLHQLRQDNRIGSVIFRVNASALVLSPASTVQSLAQQATAVVQVETPSSLQAYPILAKERRRQIPKRMHGLVLLLRKKKNGRTSESVEYFQVVNDTVVYSTSSDSDAPSTATQPATASVSVPTSQSSTTSKALPVRADEVSFNLSISEEEASAKRRVELPYMHQGNTATAGSNNLLFIDDDDPDWDDDDLDDDLDI